MKKELMQMIAIIAAAMTALIGLMVWYVKYQTRQQTIREDKQDKERIQREFKRDTDQKEERDYYRALVKEDLRKNMDLNVQGISLQKEMMKDIQDHNGNSQKAWGKTIDTLSILCDKMNGGSPDIKRAKESLNQERRKKNIEVKVDRRK